MRMHPDHPNVNIGRKDHIVYYEHCGKLCMRIHSDPKNPRTKKQQTNLGIYGLISEISSKTKKFRAFCFQDLETYHNSHTAFLGIQMMWLNSLKDHDRNQLIKKLKWSTGDREHPTKLELEKHEKWKLTWEESQGILAKSDLSAKAMWIAYDCKSSTWKWRLNAGTRDSGSCELNLPAQWSEEDWYLWLMFYDKKRKRFSRTARIIVPKGNQSAKETYPDQRRYMLEEDVVIKCWIESRKLRGNEQKRYNLFHKKALEWRPWL